MSVVDGKYFHSDDDKRCVQENTPRSIIVRCVTILKRITHALLNEDDCYCCIVDKRRLLLLQSNKKCFFFFLVCSRCDSLYRQGDAVERFSNFFVNQTNKRKVGPKNFPLFLPKQ